MKIEAGKWYRLSDGLIVGPLKPTTPPSRPGWVGQIADHVDPEFWWFVDDWGVPGLGQIVAEYHDDAPPQDYIALRDVLDAALQQAAKGKGAERHAGGRPFTDQPIATITRAVGVAFPLGQALKKTQEAAGMVQRGERDAAERDLLGAIVYLAAAVLAIRDGVK